MDAKIGYFFPIAYKIFVFCNKTISRQNGSAIFPIVRCPTEDSLPFERYFSEFFIYRSDIVQRDMFYQKGHEHLFVFLRKQYAKHFLSNLKMFRSKNCNQ